MKRLPRRRSAGMTLADLLVVVVLIPLVSVVLAGCVWRTRCGGNNVKCAANLKSIGQALMLYANENHGAFPRTAYQPGEKVIPTWGTGATSLNPFGPSGPEPNDVTAALFLLIRTQECTSEVFICPSSNGERWDFGAPTKSALHWSNWEEGTGIPRHLTYSMQNPYPDAAAVASGFKWNQELGADFALLADINAGASKPDTNVLKAKVADTAAHDRRRGNSRNHGGDGQNVLFGDGHVDFAVTPFTGVNQDNIYARRAGPEGTASSDVRNSSFDARDNVLLPTDE